MKLIFSFDPTSFISFSPDKGQLEIEVVSFTYYTPPYISSWFDKKNNETYNEKRGYHVQVNERTGKIKLILYRRNDYV